LELFSKNNLDAPGRYFLHFLPTLTGHGYYEYRIMIDNETNDRTCWGNYQLEGDEGRGLTLNWGDILLKRKG
jgi:hypothetical protein